METLSTPRSRRALRLALRALRDGSGLSQLKAANGLRRKMKINMNSTRWCYLENGELEATPEERIAIEKFFRVPEGSIPWVTVPKLVLRPPRVAAAS